MTPFSINIKGRLLTCETPLVMGILNVTPDSFYSASRCWQEETLERTASRLIADGADIIDIGGYSSRPGASDVPAEEEKRRIALGIKTVKRIAPDMPVSVDTFRSDVARAAVLDHGAEIINDIAGGDLDDKMFDTVVELNVPYIAMHMRGTAAQMQSLTDYTSSGGVTADIIASLSKKIDRLEQKGVTDIIIDPGFGFAKTIAQNFEVLRDLRVIGNALRRPILVGLSRKSMIYRTLDITPEESLNGTTVINTLALERGAAILRVHDVAEARQAVTLWREADK
ncbi:MAG: dihydropteroate synthase [Muribaculaceae bacterium]|nr:dihydropteroate synthase [Muribaculaceae bacterium]